MDLPVNESPKIDNNLSLEHGYFSWSVFFFSLFAWSHRFSFLHLCKQLKYPRLIKLSIMTETVTVVGTTKQSQLKYDYDQLLNNLGEGWRNIVMNNVHSSQQTHENLTDNCYCLLLLLLLSTSQRALE